MKKSVSILFLLVFSVVLVSFPPIKVAKAQGTIYIRADGSVEGTDTIQREGNVYTFTDSIINQSIVVEKNNTVIDGADFTLQGIFNGLLIDIRYISNVTIKNIQIIGSGIQLLAANNNTISRNLITGGINFLDSNYNNIVGNTFLGNANGIYLLQSNNNSFYDNSFINNTKNVYDQMWVQPWYPQLLSINFWDNGTTGNYWSDYNGTDNDGDGIGDTPYVIDHKNQDNYPLMTEFIIPEFPSWTPLLIMIVAVVAITAIYRRRLPKSNKRGGYQ